MVEWPVVLMGSFDAAFLEIPDEVIRATIRNNQKCFVVRDPKPAGSPTSFILTANTEAADAGRAIIAGNERVIRARLSDAKFFYETDLKIRLEDRLPKFKDIVFHERLGTQPHAGRVVAGHGLRAHASFGVRRVRSGVSLERAEMRRAPSSSAARERRLPDQGRTPGHGARPAARRREHWPRARWERTRGRQ